LKLDIPARSPLPDPLRAKHPREQGLKHIDCRTETRSEYLRAKHPREQGLKLAQGKMLVTEALFERNIHENKD